MLLLAADDTVDATTVRLALPQATAGSAAVGSTGSGPLAERAEAFEREVLLAELKRHHHHMTNTAKALGLERSHLYKKCQQLGIDLRAVRKDG
jgi:DNA-binding NtrC family response regulator